MIFLDSNIVIDLLNPGTEWHEWSVHAVARAAHDALVCNHIVVAEVASRFSTLEEELGHFAVLSLQVLPIGDAAAFRAGKAHDAYRAAGGKREAIVADFLIAGHAAVLGATLMTRDRRRFATYFPNLTLITPETHPHG